MTLQIYHAEFGEIPEQHRALCVSDPKRGFRLDCDIDEVVKGLKAGLRRERITRALYEGRLRDLLAPKRFSAFRKFCREKASRDGEALPGKLTTDTATAVEVV